MGETVVSRATFGMARVLGFRITGRRLVEAPACQQPSHSCRAATGQRVQDQRLNHGLKSWPGSLQVAASDLV
ncbi:hypothetical protein CSOJ01_06104 [Colletotrichum sojae]|uniref:Uncharacterized protein n=1 Tax=Colletotrichum sojae TaxID=2175907 RepID=A0A8H6JD34_9PEZI|nr:hypothetical protein CSOJ01_06104 [Colletotrichum sojae]